jgi:hypothetical protein
MTVYDVRPAVIVSIDLGSAESSVESAARLELANIVSGLGISASWFDHDPAGSPAIDDILGLRVVQEIGVLADDAWAESGTSRAVFLRELSRRVARAAASGYQISTLALPKRRLADHHDLLAKQGITALRREPARQSPSRWAGSLPCIWRGDQPRESIARLARFGLWHVDVSFRFPSRDRFLLSTAARQAERQIGRASGQEPFHLALDLPLLSGRGRGAMKLAERILVAVARRQEELSRRVATIRELVTRLADQHRGVPAQSILRRRAA